jgi:hypothetical protein
MSKNSFRDFIRQPFSKRNAKRRTKKFNNHLIEFEAALQTLEQYKNDPAYYAEETVREIKNKIDLKREQLKLSVNLQIDQFYDDLNKKIDQELTVKKEKFDRNVQVVCSFKDDLKNADPETAEAGRLEELIKEMPQKKKLLNDAIEELKEKKLVFCESKETFEVEKYFGQLSFSENSSQLQPQLQPQMYSHTFSPMLTPQPIPSTFIYQPTRPPFINPYYGNLAAPIASYIPTFQTLNSKINEKETLENRFSDEDSYEAFDDNADDGTDHDSYFDINSSQSINDESNDEKAPLLLGYDGYENNLYTNEVTPRRKAESTRPETTSRKSQPLQNLETSPSRSYSPTPVECKVS